MKIENLSFGYKNNEILNNINLNFEDKITIIIGLNGEGKTTFANLIMGFLKPDQGIITFDGKKVICPSENILPAYVSIYEIITSQKLSLDRLNFLLKMFECEKYQHTFIKDLSFGTQKKMNLIIAFMQKCELIILDEPSTGLDVISQLNLINLINDDKRQFIIISHDFNLVKETSQKVLIMSKCKIKQWIYTDELELKNRLQEISKTNE